MTEVALIHELSARHVVLVHDARDLRVRAPVGAVDEQMLDRLSEGKIGLRDRIGRVLATPRGLLERRVVRATHELDSGREEAMGREFAPGHETVRTALVQAEADLALYRMASTKSDSEDPTERGAGPGTQKCS